MLIRLTYFTTRCPLALWCPSLLSPADILAMQPRFVATMPCDALSAALRKRFDKTKHPRAAWASEAVVPVKLVPLARATSPRP